MGKIDFRNSLTKTAINHYDNSLIRTIPKESQDAHKAYSIDSDIFNDYYRRSKKEFREMYGHHARDEVEILIKDLRKSIIVLEYDLVVYRGFDIKNIDPVKLKAEIYGGFISTSLDEAIALGYTRGTGKTIGVIVPKGTVIYLRDHSIYPNHMEILILPEYYMAKFNIEGKIVYKIVKR